jgi:hypothetical protein
MFRLSERSNMPTIRKALMLFALVAGASQAASVSEDMALEAVSGWITGHGDFHGHSLESLEAFSSSPNPLWLAHLAPAGFLLLSGDDAARPVLGFAAEGDFSLEPGSPSTRAFVDSCAGTVRALAGSSNAEARAEWDRLLAGQWQAASRDVIVQPLISCNWDQGTGWNDLCPLDGAGPGGRVLVGCVAVSMAQVMYYWNQPRQGVGSHGYNSDYGWLEVDFAAADYDWSLIYPNTPSYESAELLYHCGVAVDMMYGPDGSGAYVGWGNPSALTAMEDHFGFLTSASFEERGDYNSTQWRMLLQSELDAGRPMIYRGYGSAGGHAWNLDGYRDDDYFHFNWGWGGAYNGWFLSEGLSPGGMSFNDGQAVIMGLEPVDYQMSPQAISPLAGAQAVACTPATFSWQPSPGAFAYELMIDEGPSFAFPEIYVQDLETTSFVTEELANYSTYYWRVRALGEQGWSPWSPAAEFTTEYWQTTPSPEQATPLNGVQNFNLDPSVFVWAFVAGGESYTLQVAADPDFTSLVIDEGGITEHYLVLYDVLEEDQDYWWRVSCVGLSGESEWSDVRSLHTEGATAIESMIQPQDWSLGAAWPNPFNPATQIPLFLQRAAEVELRIYDLSGRLVDELVNGWIPAGEHTMRWAPTGQAAGIYLLEARVGAESRISKLTLLK